MNPHPNKEEKEKPWVEKRISLRELIFWHPAWAEYYWSKLISNERSAMGGLPARTETHINRDPETGDYLIRYLPI